MPVAVPFGPFCFQFGKSGFQPRGQFRLSFCRLDIACHDLLLKFGRASSFRVTSFTLDFELGHR